MKMEDLKKMDLPRLRAVSGPGRERCEVLAAARADADLEKRSSQRRGNNASSKLWRNSQTDDRSGARSFDRGWGLDRIRMRIRSEKTSIFFITRPRSYG